MTVIVVKVENVAVSIANDGSYGVVIYNHSVQPVVVGNGVGVMNESTRIDRHEALARMNFFRIRISNGVNNFVYLAAYDQRKNSFDEGSEILIIDLGGVPWVNPFLSNRPCDAGSPEREMAPLSWAKRRDPKQFHLLQPLRHP